MGFANSWIYFGRCLVSSDGSLRIAASRIQNSELQVSIAELGIDTYCLLQLRLNLLGAGWILRSTLRLGKGDGVIIMCHSISRLLMRKTSQCLLHARQLRRRRLSYLAEEKIGIEVCRFQVRRLAEPPGSFIGRAVGVKGGTEPSQHPG